MHWSKEFVKISPNVSSEQIPMARVCSTGIISDGKFIIFGGHHIIPKTQIPQIVFDEIFCFNIGIK